MDPYAWSWNPEALLVIPVLSVAYVLAARAFPAPRWRVVCFAAAMILLLAVTVTPVETIGLNYLLTLHLVQNVVLAEWAPALAVLGIPPALAAVLPRVPAVPALLLWLVNYAVWHLPWLYDTALRNPHTLLHLEHALYFATGVLLWWPVVHGARPPGFKAGYLFAAFAAASPIGLLLALIPDAIYDFYVDAPDRLWGLSALADQQIAGVTMALEQATVFFAAFALYVARFFREQDALG
ncbi:MAG: cytochrome c oxidase assembly protein [Gaiellaceae bacterium MAG52_C11]|nr:cytochrome c oxidase assembly protein [Candidatus Gaiellasilicea maunaloa]